MSFSYIITGTKDAGLKTSETMRIIDLLHCEKKVHNMFHY